MKHVTQGLRPETDDVVRRTICIASGARLRAGRVSVQGVGWSAKASGLRAREFRSVARAIESLNRAKFETNPLDLLGHAKCATSWWCHHAAFWLWVLAGHG